MSDPSDAAWQSEFKSTIVSLGISQFKYDPVNFLKDFSVQNPTYVAYAVAAIEYTTKKEKYTLGEAISKVLGSTQHSSMKDKITVLNYCSLIDSKNGKLST